MKRLLTPLLLSTLQNEALIFFRSYNCNIRIVPFPPLPLIIFSLLHIISVWAAKKTLRFLVFLIQVHTPECLFLKASVWNLRWASGSANEQKRLCHS